MFDDLFIVKNMRNTYILVDMILYNLKYLVLSYSLEDLPKKLLVVLIKVVSQSEMKSRLNYSGI